jgi:SAM-dependent methyltransferase
LNLINMAERKDKNLVLSDSAQPSKRKLRRILYRGLSLSASEEPAVTIKNVLRWYPFCDGTTVTGWAIQSFNHKHKNGQLEVCFKDAADNVIASQEIKVSSKITPVILPKLTPHSTESENFSLTLRLKGSRSKFFPFGSKNTKPNHAFLTVHEVLHREEIIKKCQGKGIEIGPGPKPQVIPSRKVDVTYVEQSAPEDWERLYNDTGNYKVSPQLWSRYQIGEACDLPVENNSLDFIFSSHVFEHLANPLGHLKHWQTKLKDGGKVLGIVPDLSGCKDYVYRPSSMSEILAEQTSGNMEPTIEHYARWAKYRRPGKNPEEFYKAKRSIHVHYYTKWNMTEILQYAVENLGYTSFEMRYVPNHKDFYFVLLK